MAKGKGGKAAMKNGTHLAAPGSKTVMNGKKSSGGGKTAPQVRVGTHLTPPGVNQKGPITKGNARGR